MSKTDPQITSKMGSKGVIVFNPSSGDGDAGELKDQLRRYLGPDRFDLLELEEGMNLCEELEDAIHDRSYQWIGAAGGDGTVSIVGSCLVDLNMPLVIIPSGTGNAIAGALGIPEDVEEACRLLLDGSETRTIDAIRIKDRYYFLQVGMGLEALTMEETTTEQKNMLGELAYLWTAAREAIDWQPQQIKLTVDGDEQLLEASEVVLANIGDVGVFDLRWGEDIRPDDGRLDVVVIAARSANDYTKVVTTLARGAQAESDLFTYFKAFDRVCIEAKRPLPIHGDGEEMKNPLPLEAHLIPDALTVVVPEENAKERLGMKIITGLFEPSDAFQTLDQLLARGYSRENLSLISSSQDMPDFLEGDPENSAAEGAAIGAVAGGSVGALGAWIMPAIPGFETMIAAGMLTTAAGSVIGAFLGSIFNVRAESQTEIDVHDALANGKYLLIASVKEDQIEEVTGLFEAGQGFDLEVNDMPEANIDPV